MNHHYGKQVHLISTISLKTRIAQMGHPETFQPQMNFFIERIYLELLWTVLQKEFPTKTQSFPTRMAQFHPEANISGEFIDPHTSVVCVNLARAGTLPSHICYSELNTILNPQKVRQDHISISRSTDDKNQVKGAQVSGHKIGGSIDNAIVLIPDPMGATGNTIVETRKLYEPYGTPQKWITIHSIVTPEYLKKVTTECPDVTVYAGRLDRGLSSEKVLNSEPGEFWDEEKGLNENQYIVPGAGGIGEVLNNSFV
ncbi:MAG: uracil phosphoribosyltransferase [Bdellovibrionaceae bacterium]|nr:uracil phosphoribosyltransferase [Pseudobdellovibrionaceae bacterium]|tara:strand:+ start:3542 stop:4306 length:765 start_codon:yes stop_codon:yes gene_type:complete